MTQIDQNVVMWQGDDHQIDFTVTDSAGAAVNIASASAIQWVLAASDTSAALVSKSLVSGIGITNGPAGQFRVTLVPADTTALAGNYYHEARVTISGVTSTVAVGEFVIHPTVL